MIQRVDGYKLLNFASRIDDNTIEQAKDALVGCDAVALLPDWHLSRGARLEVSIADALGMPVRVVEAWRNSA